MAAETYTIMEKMSLARSRSPWPMVLAISAPPPVPNMNPTQPKPSSTGMIRFTAAKGVFPA